MLHDGCVGYPSIFIPYLTWNHTLLRIGDIRRLLGLTDIFFSCFHDMSHTVCITTPDYGTN